MRWQVLGAVGLALALFVSPAAALAHGAPSLTVKEPSVAAGGRVTLSGDALGESGDTVQIALEGTGFQAPLGTVTLKGDTFDNVQLQVPANTPPGTYLLKATNGPIVATAQVEVTASSASASSASAGQSAIAPVRRTPLEWAVSVGLVVATAALAVLLLWRTRQEQSGIDW